MKCHKPFVSEDQEPEPKKVKKDKVIAIHKNSDVANSSS